MPYNWNLNEILWIKDRMFNKFHVEEIVFSYCNIVILIVEVVKINT